MNNDDHFQLQLEANENIISPRRKKSTKKPSTLSSLKHLNGVGAIGFEIVLPMTLGIIIGTKLDSHWGTKSTFTVIGFTLGFVLACASLIRIVKEAGKSA